MTKPKPINFRPGLEDQFLIDKLMNHFEGEEDFSKSDLIRMALTSLAVAEFGNSETAVMLGDARLNNYK